MTAIETAAEAALRAQTQLDHAVAHYSTLDEVAFARQNVLEVMRLHPEDVTACQMMLGALRARRVKLERRAIDRNTEFRGGSVSHCAESVHGAPPQAVSSQEPSAADLSR